MNAIAFSLYGNNPRYLVGAVENVRQAREFYPGWEVHFWLGNEILPPLQDELFKTGAILHAAPGDITNGMFWRFLVHDLPGVERYIIRDVDSRFSEREIKAVNEWIAAGTQLHVMRDHPYHSQVMMGGMFGWLKMRGDKLVRGRTNPYDQSNKWGADIQFLHSTLFKEARSKTVHDSCGTFDGTHNWPSDGESFVGEYINEHGSHNQHHRQMRQMRLKHLYDSDAPQPRVNVLYLLPHLGLGDAIVCNGLFRALSTRCDRLVIPCKWHNRASVAWMLSDLPNVHLLGVKDDREARLWANHFESGRSKVLRLGLHSISRLRQDWDRQLYEQAGVNFEERWRGFTLPASNGVELLDSPVPFVHDDSKRGFQIPSNKLPGTWSYVGRQHSTIWPNLHWLQTAPEVHVIDSCFLCLADSVPTKGRLVLHAYATAAAKPMGPPTLRKQWEILK